ncbi:MAG: hypothetical protein HKN11_03430 [Rhizobiales bacterium]|nr:hypothetical protein [Hyphomicrobiales bacterium]
MPSLIDFSKSECITYTIGRELNELERLVSAHHPFKDAELMDLSHCLARMSRIVGGLAGDGAGDPLPDWLQRQNEGSPSETGGAQSV